jgi:uncharacterized protein (UPF0332 family)
VRDWAGFLELARKLATSDGDAELRSALSRAYYSAYQDARKYRAEKDLSFVISRRDPEPHANVWNWYSTLPGKVAQVSTLGFGLRSKRNKADYEVYTPFEFLKHEVGDALTKAARILSLLAEARTPPAPPPPRPLPARG